MPLLTSTSRVVIGECISKTVERGFVFSDHESFCLEVYAEVEIIEVGRKNTSVAGEDVATQRFDHYGIIKVTSTLCIPFWGVDHCVVDSHEYNTSREEQNERCNKSKAAEDVRTAAACRWLRGFIGFLPGLGATGTVIVFHRHK